MTASVDGTASAQKKGNPTSPSTSAATDKPFVVAGGSGLAGGGGVGPGQYGEDIG